MTWTPRYNVRLHEASGRMVMALAAPPCPARPRVSFSDPDRDRSVRSAACRARRRIIEVCTENKLDRLWTLTRAYSPVVLPGLWEDVRRFGRRLQTLGFTDRIVVPELEKGRWHVHMATALDIPSDLVAEAWRLGRVGPPDGRYFDDGGRGCLRLALYVSKDFAEPPS